MVAWWEGVGGGLEGFGGCGCQIWADGCDIRIRLGACFGPNGKSPLRILCLGLPRVGVRSICRRSLYGLDSGMNQKFL